MTTGFIQGAGLGFLFDFKLMMILALGAMPLVLLPRKAAAPAKMVHSAAMA